MRSAPPNASVTAIHKLDHLAAAIGGLDSLRSALAPFHRICERGIEAAPLTDSEADEILHPTLWVNARTDEKPMTPQLPGSMDDLVLPVPFTDSDFLAFLTVRPDLAWTIEQRYTNDPPSGDPAALPLDETTMARLELQAPGLAALLRSLLPAGGRWWHAGDGLKPNSATATPPRRLLASVAQGMAILAKLTELGFDPLALPPFRPGHRSEAKLRTCEALKLPSAKQLANGRVPPRDDAQMSGAVFATAWKRLTKSGQIKYG